jgi:hypothetical protein
MSVNTAAHPSTLSSSSGHNSPSVSLSLPASRQRQQNLITTPTNKETDRGAVTEAFAASTAQALALADTQAKKLSCALLLESNKGLEMVKGALRDAEVRLAAEAEARGALQRAADVESRAMQNALKEARAVRCAPRPLPYERHVLSVAA